MAVATQASKAVLSFGVASLKFVAMRFYTVVFHGTCVGVQLGDINRSCRYASPPAPMYIRRIIWSHVHALARVRGGAQEPGI